MKVQPSTLGWLVLTGALSVALVVSHWPRPDPAEKVPAEIRRSADSLKTTQPEAEHRRDSILRVVAVDTERAVRAERLAKARKDSAEGFRKRADSSAAQARLYGDSSFLWRVAYDNRTEEADQLRASLVSSDSALKDRTASASSFRLLWIDAEARRRTAEEFVIPGLEKAIRRLEQPCRIVGPIRCPSRRFAFVAGVAGAVVALSASK